MKIKPLFLLPGAIALVLGAAAPMLPTFTDFATAGPGKMGGRGAKWQELNLTEQQKAQMREIRQSTRQKMDAVFTAEQRQQLQTARQQRQRPNLNLTEDQKTQMKAIRQEAKQQMDAVLTAEQRQKLQEMRQQKRQSRGNRMNPQQPVTP